MSSILDLSSEADRLEQALKDNDLLSLRKILSIHQNKFSLVPGIQWSLLVPPGSRIHSVSGWENFTHGPGTGGGGCCGVGGGGIDPASNRTRSHSAASVGRHSVNSLLPAADLQLRKFSHSNPLQTCPMSVLTAGPFDGPTAATAAAPVPVPDSRRDSCCTDIAEVPVPHVFRTALHVAIQHNAVSALTLLLASGVDPNRIPGPPTTSSSGTVPDGGLRRGDGGAFPDSLFGSRKHSRDSSVGYPNNGYSDSAAAAKSGSGQDGGSSSRKTSFGSAEGGSNHRRPDRMSSFGTAVSKRLRLPARSMNNLTSATSSSESRSMDAEPEVTVVPDHRKTQQHFNDHHHQQQHHRSWDFYGEYTLEHLYTLPPLFMAAAFRNEVAVRLLLQYGASPAVRDRLGCTPLHLATSDEFLSVDCAMTLVKNGARLHARNSFGVTPCHAFPELASRQTRLLDRHLVTLTNYFRNRDKASGKNPDGGRGGGGRGDHFRFGASLFRRSRRSGGESRKGNARGAKDLHQRRHRWMIDRDKESSVDRDRSASISSSKSRLSFNVNVSSSVTQNHLEEVEMDVVNNDLEKVQ